MLDQPFRGRGWQAARAATSDERLAALAAADRTAFEQLWERHHRGVLAFCRQMLGRREDAEDAVQQTFLAAYRALGRGTKPRHFRAWLYAAARNHCLAVREAGAEEMLADVEVDVEDSASLPAVVERREEIRQMLGDMRSLPEDQRAALALSTLRPMKHEDIARVLDCTRAEVKALVFQARASLASSRREREIPCAEIRRQLAASQRSALRRAVVRRHLRQCAACRAFRYELRHQREIGALILLLPPSADLKRHAMELVFGGAAAGGVAGAGLGVAALGHKAGALIAAAAVLGALSGAAVRFGSDARDPAPEVRFSSTAGASGAPPAADLLGGGRDHRSGVTTSQRAGNRARTTAARAARRHRRAISARQASAGDGGTGAGGNAPASTTAPALPEGPHLPQPQLPSAELPATPQAPSRDTHVEPPASLPPTSTLPPAEAVPAPQLPQPLPTLP